MRKCRVHKLISIIIAFLVVIMGLVAFFPIKNASAMPFYDLYNKEIVLRSRFYTSFPKSTVERKHNIRLASSALNNTFLDVGEEFSFNRVVGERTEKRGYRQAKIIVNGEFVDGVGGGVCQVSTTLYNAVLLAGLKISEYHPHSLAVSYVAPSFDAMVNSNWADLKFVNDTRGPVYIKTKVIDDKLFIEIYGEKNNIKILRESVVTGEILPDSDEIKVDYDNQYPELKKGEQKYLRYGKAGLTSEGYLIKSVNGKTVSVKKLRTDKYKAIRGLIIEGNAEIIDTEDKNLIILEKNC